MHIGGARSGHGNQPRIYRLAALALAAACVLSGCSPAADAIGPARAQVQAPLPAEITARLDAAVTEATALSGSTGALVGVWAPWAGTWVASPGATAATSPGELNTAMRFRIGTNTTSMTCTVLLRLADEGEVALDDLVTTYLPRMVGLEGITLGQLCRSTSGLADYSGLLAPQFVGNPTREWPAREVMASGMGQPRLALPGGTWSRSDTGIVVLGLALHQATGRDWPWLYKHYILRPLDMGDTSLPGSKELQIPGANPRGYAAALDPAGAAVCDVVLDVTELSPSMGGVAAGAVSTLEDMKTWAQALAEGRLLSEEGADAQWATIPQASDAPAWKRYGLGAEELGPLRGQTGMIPGFLSAAFADPVSGLTVVVAFNNSTSGRDFVEAVALRLAAIAATAPPAGDEPGPALALPWSEEDAAAASRAGAVCPSPVPAG